MVEKLDKLDTRVSFKQCVNLMRFIYGTALSVNAKIYDNYEFLCCVRRNVISYSM
jgi:hypothetical protein